MKTFKALYAILSFLEAALEMEDFPSAGFNAAAFRVNKAHFDRILEMLADKGYVKGVHPQPVVGRVRPAVMVENPSITMDGLEYLHENRMMAKAADARSWAADD